LPLQRPPAFAALRLRLGKPSRTKAVAPKHDSAKAGDDEPPVNRRRLTLDA
jgi:hypothetical protein